MQPNELTLAVDLENKAVLTNKIYTRFEEYLNRAMYIGAGHSLSARNTLSFYRTMPRISGNFRGTAKTAVKFSRDVSVLGVDGTTVVAPQILEVSFSNPVGVTPAQSLEFRQNGVALLDRDDIMAALNDLLMV